MGRHNWPVIIADLETTPGQWRLVFRNHSTRAVETVRQRRSPDLHISDGVVEAIAVNSYSTTPGSRRRRGDIYLRYIPTPPESTP